MRKTPVYDAPSARSGPDTTIADFQKKMIHAIEKKASALNESDSNNMLVLIDDEWVKIPKNKVLEVSHFKNPLPTPFNSPSLKGMVEFQQSIVPQIKLAKPNSTTFRPDLHHYPYSLFIETEKGPIGLAVQGISSNIELGVTNTPSAMDEIHQSIADFSPQSPDPHRLRALQNSVKAEDFLLIMCHGTPLAVRAQEVNRVVKPTSAQKLGGPHAGHHLVNAEGQLMAAQSLSHCRDGREDTGPSGSVPWCLCLGVAGAETGLLVQEVLGLVTAPRDQLKTLLINGKKSTWLMRPQQDAVEILNLVSLGLQGFDAAPASADADADATTGLYSFNSLKDDLAERVTEGLTPATRGQSDHLCLQTDAFQVVLSADEVKEVLGHLDPSALLPRRRSGASVVLDLPRLLGLPGIAPEMLPEAWAVRLTHAGGKVILMVPRVDRAQDTHPWHKLPALPEALTRLFESVRIRDDAIQWLLKPLTRQHRKISDIRQRLEPATLGWWI